MGGLLLVTVVFGVSLVAPLAQAQTPRYITAKPDAVARVYGAETALRVFSDAYTPARRQAVLRSQQSVPGYDCPADPQIALEQVIPYPIRQGVVSWIERYVVGCKPPTMRNFLFILEGSRPHVIDMLPGTTNTDPLLQRDALQGAVAFAGALSPKGCDKRVVVDTRLASPIERGKPWTERWVYDLCGTRAEVEMTFTPSEAGGTTWGATLVK
jgi:hypothetical protein